MDAVKPLNEDRRLAALMGYDLLDSEPETPFEDVVDLLLTLCEVPVALVSLVDSDRQWFKARRGLEASETPLDQSICAHAILGREILEIEDTQNDTRTVDNPLCVGDGRFRFYAGAPLVTPDGMALGSLCVLDYQPRRLTDVQRQGLTVLADQVMAQIRLRKALKMQDTMRREVDHRVRNSLQLLSALTRYEARRAEHPETRQALDRFGRRISSVALVHEQLYSNSAGHIVALDGYMETLAAQLAEMAPAQVTITGQADRVGIDWRDATLIGTLFNEAVANSLKHAFPDGRRGTIRYAAHLDPQGLMHFSCEDDGVGLGAGAGSTGHGLGTTLQEVIGLELDGELSVEAIDQGTRVSVAFRPRATGHIAAA